MKVINTVFAMYTFRADEENVNKAVIIKNEIQSVFMLIGAIVEKKHPLSFKNVISLSF